MYFDKHNQEWRYEDDNSLVKETWKYRSCGRCGKQAASNDHDPCISNLPGVRNACCGHGDTSVAYVQFLDGTRKSGAAALQWAKGYRTRECKSLCEQAREAENDVQVS
jgi:hypothetical protein